MNPIYKPVTVFLFATLMCSLSLTAEAQNRKLTFDDIMKWEDISDVDISAGGEWLVYRIWPDRGDGEDRVRNIGNEVLYTIERGDNPVITRDGEWVGVYIKPPFAEELKNNKDKTKQE